MKKHEMWAIYSPLTETFFRSHLNFEANLIKSFLSYFYEANFYETKEQAQAVLIHLREKQAIEAYFYCENSKKKKKKISESFKVVKIEFPKNEN